MSRDPFSSRHPWGKTQAEDGAHLDDPLPALAAAILTPDDETLPEHGTDGGLIDAGLDAAEVDDLMDGAAR